MSWLIALLFKWSPKLFNKVLDRLKIAPVAIVPRDANTCRAYPDPERVAWRGGFVLYVNLWKADTYIPKIPATAYVGNPNLQPDLPDNQGNPTVKLFVGQDQVEVVKVTEAAPNFSGKPECDPTGGGPGMIIHP